jgi:hypothetical protein
MVNIPLGKSDFRRSVAASPFIRLRNRFFEQNPANLVEQSALLSRPALKRWLTVGAGPNRGLYSQPGSFNDALFAMSGRELYSVESDLSVTLIGGGFFAEDDLTTRASMAATAAIGASPEWLFIADGTVLRLYEPDTFARGELNTPSGIADADVVRIGAVYYRFTNGGVNAGTPAGTSGNPWLVARNASVRVSLSNLRAAINASGVAGTTYSTALTANAEARAVASTVNTLFVEARVAGTAGNSVVTTTTIVGASWLSGTLQNGVSAGLRIVDVPEGLEAISVAFIGGYIIVVAAPRNGFKGRWYWLEPGEDFIRPENFNTAERSPDPLVAVRTVGDQIALFGTTSTEMWYLTGDALEPFARSTASIFERGVWEGSDVQIKDTLLVMDTDGAVYRIDGGGPRRISDASIEERTRRAIKQAVTQVGPPPPVDSALSVSLQSGGQATSAASPAQVYAPNLATATGGVAPYSYRWFFTGSNNLGTFGFVGSQTTELITPQAVSVQNASTASALLNCEVTDSVGTRVLATPGAAYSHQNTLPVGAQPPNPVPTFVVGVSPTVQSTDGFQQSSQSFAPVTAVPQGGTGPFTYLWYFEGTGGETWTMTDATVAAVSVQVANVPSGSVAVADMRCRVTDSLGNFGVSPPVTFTHFNRDFPDFGGFIP